MAEYHGIQCRYDATTDSGSCMRSEQACTDCIVDAACLLVVNVGNLGPSCLLRRKGVISFGAFVNIISRLVLP